jgi:putative membrane protein
MSVPASIREIERPVEALMAYYVLASLRGGPGFFVVLLLDFFRYRTLRYRFDDEGVSMSWGILFRRQINLTFARIQDIHLHSNIVERWLGLAKIEIQTASGNSEAEMTIEGVKNFLEVRDFLYSRMRGATAPAAVAQASGSGESEELADLLRATAAELRGIREALEARQRSTDGSQP